MAWGVAMMETIAPISESLAAFVAKQDSKLNAKAGYESNFLAENLRVLLEHGKVEVGWRESCGSTDRTMFMHRAWCEVIKRLGKDGFEIKQEPQKHGNSWATKAGGFWSSIVYSLGQRPVSAA